MIAPKNASKHANWGSLGADGTIRSADFQDANRNHVDDRDEVAADVALVTTDVAPVTTVAESPAATAAPRPGLLSRVPLWAWIGLGLVGVTVTALVGGDDNEVETNPPDEEEVDDDDPDYEEVEVEDEDDPDDDLEGEDGGDEDGEEGDE